MNASLCAYCGMHAATRDHIPPASLFRSSGLVDYNPILVPACTACNNSASHDDEVFKELIVSLGLGHSPHAQAIFNQSITRSLKKGRGKTVMEIWSGMALAIAHNDENKLSEATIIQISDFHWDVLTRVVTRISRGIYWKHHNESIVPDIYDVKTRFLPKQNLIELTKEIPFLLGEHGKTHPIFNYAYSFYTDGPGIIIIEFYENISFTTFIAPPGTLIDDPNISKHSYVLDLRTAL